MTHQVELSPGTILGSDFRIQKPLSAGGMGAVYVAEQITTGKQRALKLMHPQLVADAKLRERFEQEARVGSMIPSDHVVQVIGAGIDQATGMPWLAMELLEGEDLSAHIRANGALPVSEVRVLFEQICHGLGAAHSVGVVHRDVKPENIFLAKTRTATGPIAVRILDFGIAKVAAEAKTMATAAIGTPLWMAPEQTDPRAPITPAADVWSLGLIAFTMLTGRVYWKAASDPLAAMTALMREMLFEPIANGSQRASELGFVGSIPEGFDAWLARCLSRDPKRRFTDARDAMEALGLALSSNLVEIDGSTASAAGGALNDLAGAPTALADMPTDAFIALSEEKGGTPSGAVVAAASGPAADAGTPAGAVLPALPALAIAATAAAEPVRRRKAPIATVAGALLGAVVTAGLFAYFKNEPAPPSPPPPSVAASASVLAEVPSTTVAPVDLPATAIPIVSSADSPLSASLQTSAPAPLAPTGKPVAPPKASPKPRPFDFAAAQRSVNQNATDAKFVCSHSQGPRGIPATVIFAPPGNVQRVALSPEIAASGTGQCVMMVLFRSRVPPFDGPGTQSMGTAVILP